LKKPYQNGRLLMLPRLWAIALLFAFKQLTFSVIDGKCQAVPGHGTPFGITPTLVHLKYFFMLIILLLGAGAVCFYFFFKSIDFFEKI
jgi:hypothetical protein